MASLTKELMHLCTVKAKNSLNLLDRTFSIGALGKMLCRSEILKVKISCPNLNASSLKTRTQLKRRNSIGVKVRT